MTARGGTRRRAFSLLALALLAAPAVATGGRVVAIGDIHGSLDGLTTILQEAGLTDADNQWIGGRDRVVQTGDFTDRGADVRPVMELLMELEGDARAAGGELTVLLGNHEVLNLMRHDDDVAVNPAIYASFVDGRSAERRRQALADWRQWLDERRRIEGLAPPPIDSDEKWLERHPEGFVEYHEAMSSKGRYGRWIRTLPVVRRIDDTLFVHGGLSETFTRVGIERINELHREEIEALDQTLSKLERKGIIPPWFTWPEIIAELEARLADREIKKQRALAEEAKARLDRFLAITSSAESPLWYRGYSAPPHGLADEELAELADVLTAAFDARTFVVAHSPFHGKDIAQRLGTFFLIDTGMLAAVYAGRPSALEITDRGYVAIYPGQRQVLSAAGGGGAARSEPPGGALRVAADGGRQRFVFASMGPLPRQAAGEEAPFESPPRRWLDPDGQPLPFADHEEVEEYLAHAQILGSEPIAEGKTGARRLELELGGVRARGIFHDIDDRRDPSSAGGPIRLSRGTTMLRFRDSYSGQVAAYRLALLLGLDLVPPAVIREVDGTEGSLALWIEGGTNLTSWRQENPRQPQNVYYQQQIYDMRVFDALINNKDRNTGNIFWTPDWNLWLIDHTRTFAQDTTLFKPDLVQQCSRDLLTRIEALDERRARAELAPYLSIFEITAIFKRRRRLLRHLTDRVEKLGTERVFFDYGDPLGRIRVGQEPAGST